MLKACNLTSKWENKTTFKDKREWMDVSDRFSIVRFLVDGFGDECVEIERLQTPINYKERKLIVGVYHDEYGAYFVWQGDYGRIYFELKNRLKYIFEYGE